MTLCNACARDSAYDAPRAQSHYACDVACEAACGAVHGAAHVMLVCMCNDAVRDGLRCVVFEFACCTLRRLVAINCKTCPCLCVVMLLLCGVRAWMASNTYQHACWGIVKRGKTLCGRVRCPKFDFLKRLSKNGAL